MGKKRNVAIMFSGGFDSAYLLLNLLNENNNLNAKLIHVSSDVLPGNKNYREKHAIDEIIKYCSKLYSNATLDLIEINIDLGAKQRAKNFGFCQPMLWIPPALLFIDNNTDIYFGYNKDDEITQYYQTENVINAIKSLSSLLNKKSISVKMPLLSITKYNIIYHIIGNHSELFFDLTCCENSRESANSSELYKTDRKCTPCTKLYNTLNQILENEIIMRKDITPIANNILGYMNARFPDALGNRRFMHKIIEEKIFTNT